MTAFPIRQPLLLGMMRLLECAELATPQALLGFIERSVERGLNGFDHADIYGLGECEARFGAALRLRPQLRAQLQLISKADIVPAAQDASQGAAITGSKVAGSAAIRGRTPGEPGVVMA